MPAPPTTVVSMERGELLDEAPRAGHTLIWLWPEELPDAPNHPAILRTDGRARALELLPGQGLIVHRGGAPRPELSRDGGQWRLCLPSTPDFADVSRAPTRVALGTGAQLTVTTEAQGPQRFWVDLMPHAGPSGPAAVPPWSALGIGPLVLWYLPLGIETAWQAITPVDPSLQRNLPGFGCYSLATARLVDDLRRRTRLRLSVPRAAADKHWEASKPFILAGEPGCGKTTLAKAVYRSGLHASGGPERFVAVHPVAVEQEIDVVALTGCANFAHDGVRVPDQEGALHALTQPDGVVLIDEAHTLDDRLKKQLIDVLTEWTFRPRGDNTQRQRIRGLLVFATNRLELLRDPRRFPHDLFARMGGESTVVELPPLRQRRWELPFLASAVLDKLTPALPLSPNARRKLLLHSWPLNHWELEDALAEAHSLALAAGDDEISPQQLKLRPPTPSGEHLAAVHLEPRDKVVHIGWRFPQRPDWTDLFAAAHHYPSFSALRDAWQAQLGAKNAAAVNRRIGRLVRCDDCDLAQCRKCFAAALTRHEPTELHRQLEELAERARVDVQGRANWIVGALKELVIDRLESLRSPAIQRAAAAAKSDPAEPQILTLLDTMRRAL